MFVSASEIAHSPHLVLVVVATEAAKAGLVVVLVVTSLGAGGTRLVRAGARRVALVGTAVGVHMDRLHGQPPSLDVYSRWPKAVPVVLDEQRLSSTASA